MTTSSHISTTFLERAQREAERYGEDRWVFLRELVQNSRDAKAATIQFSSDLRDGWTCLHCQDDGTGMSSHELEHYLLRLYASSKEADQSAVGFFGVGFWSVLLFRPTRIRVATRQGEQTHAFMIDTVERRILPADSPQMPEGTIITLARPTASKDNASQFEAEIRERLTYYCQHLRGMGDKPTPALTFNGERLNKGFKLPPHGGRFFRKQGFDGVLGFGNQPSVKIYKEGILVRDLHSLAEVIPSRDSRLPRSGLGLHPVIAININDLSVLMDRQSVSEDPVLHEAVTFIEKELLAFHRQWVRRLFPMDWRNGIKLGIHRFRANGKYLFRFLLAGLVLASVFLIASILPSKNTRGSGVHFNPLFLDRVNHASHGPIEKNTDFDTIREWQFTSSPNTKRQLFRIGTLAQYHVRRGPIQEDQFDMRPYPNNLILGSERETVQLELGGSDTFFVIPTPPNHQLIAESFRFNGQPVDNIRQNHHGDPIVMLNGPGTVTYQTGERTVPMSPPLTFPLPLKLDWPPEYRNFLETLKRNRFDPDTTLSYLAGWMKERYRYDLAPLDYPRGGKTDWLSFVVANNHGDCDILNGLLMLMMREVGHEAHLSVGLIAENGKPRRNLHAWLRYYHGGWKFFDITPHVHTDLSGENLTSAGMIPPRNQMVGGTGPAPSIPPDVREHFRGTPPPTTTQSQPSPVESVQRWQWLQASLPYVLLAVPIPFLFLLWRRFRCKKKRPEPPTLDQPEYLRDLFRHYLAHGAGEDPLQLRYRPVFPTFNGRMMSLVQLQKLSEEGRLFSAMPGQKFLDDMDPSLNVLNSDAEVVMELADFLPDLNWLLYWEYKRSGDDLPPVFQAIEATIRAWDPKFSLHLLAEGDEIDEIVLPRDKNHQVRHMIGLGPDNRLVEELPNDQHYDTFHVFHGVHTLLESTSLYLPFKDDMLTQLAAETSVTP